MAGRKETSFPHPPCSTGHFLVMRNSHQTRLLPHVPLPNGRSCLLPLPLPPTSCRSDPPNASHSGIPSDCQCKRPLSEACGLGRDHFLYHQWLPVHRSPHTRKIKVPHPPYFSQSMSAGLHWGWEQGKGNMRWILVKVVGFGTDRVGRTGRRRRYSFPLWISLIPSLCCQAPSQGLGST